jgi:hypothetical protein
VAIARDVDESAEEDRVANIDCNSVRSQKNFLSKTAMSALPDETLKKVYDSKDIF